MCYCAWPQRVVELGIISGERRPRHRRQGAKPDRERVRGKMRQNFSVDEQILQEPEGHRHCFLAQHAAFSVCTASQHIMKCDHVYPYSDALSFGRFKSQLRRREAVMVAGFSPAALAG